MQAAPSGSAACSAVSAFAVLPLAVARHILALLPADARARAAAVCSAWNTLLADPSLWTRLDVSRGSGVTTRCGGNALLRCAAARAGGRLQALHMRTPVATPDAATLLAVITANAGTLTELQLTELTDMLEAHALRALLAAAPALTDVYADAVSGPRDAEDARFQLLRREPPFAALRLAELRVSVDDHEDVLALAAALAESRCECQVLCVGAFDPPLGDAAALDALVDAVRAHRVPDLTLYACALTPACAPPLARLLGAGGALTVLAVIEPTCSPAEGAALLDAPSAALLGDALRANATLTNLPLLGCAVLGGDVLLAAMGDATTALRSRGTPPHPSLRVLFISDRKRRTPPTGPPWRTPPRRCTRSWLPTRRRCATSGHGFAHAADAAAEEDAGRRGARWPARCCATRNY
jgi:hypothetical protein